jgi:hypothetical protein
MTDARCGEVQGMAVYLGLILCSPLVERKLRTKHGLSSEDVREALQHPAEVRSAWAEDEVHGRRLIAMGRGADGRLLIAWLMPAPDWDPETEVWLIKTARWVR